MKWAESVSRARCNFEGQALFEPKLRLCAADANESLLRNEQRIAQDSWDWCTQRLQSDVAAQNCGTRMCTALVIRIDKQVELRDRSCLSCNSQTHCAAADLRLCRHHKKVCDLSISRLAHHRQRRRVSFALTLASRQSICRQLQEATGSTGSKAAISSVLDQQRLEMSYELR